MRRLVLLVLAAAIAFALVASIAEAAYLSKHDARRVALAVAGRSTEGDPGAYGFGVDRCVRQSPSRVRCQTWKHTYRGADFLVPTECRWWTYVLNRSGTLYYSRGPTSCSALR